MFLENRQQNFFLKNYFLNVIGSSYFNSESIKTIKQLSVFIQEDELKDLCDLVSAIQSS